MPEDLRADDGGTAHIRKGHPLEVALDRRLVWETLPHEREIPRIQIQARAACGQRPEGPDCPAAGPQARPAAPHTGGEAAGTAAPVIAERMKRALIIKVLVVKCFLS